MVMVSTAFGGAIIPGPLQPIFQPQTPNLLITTEVRHLSYTKTAIFLISGFALSMVIQCGISLNEVGSVWRHHQPNQNQARVLYGYVIFPSRAGLKSNFGRSLTRFHVHT
jgi:hypothetical protein